MRILLTGGQGQLGRALQAALVDHELLPLGHREMDITDTAAVRERAEGFRPDIVINAAAWTDTAACEANPERAHLVNGEGARHLAEACVRKGAALLQLSTNEVFDGQKAIPYAEDEEPNAINHYARSKLAGERYVRSIVERHYIVRTAWLYGAGRTSFPEKIAQAARQGGALKVVTDEVASPTWTVDLAAAIARLIERPAYGVYHLTNGGYCSRYQWAKLALQLVGLGDVPVEPTTQAEFGAAPRKPPFSALTNRNAARLGIELRPWEEALRAYLAEGREA